MLSAARDLCPVTAGPSLGHPGRMDTFQRWWRLLLATTVISLVATVVRAGAPPAEVAIAVWLGVTGALGAVIVHRSGNILGTLVQVAVVIAAFSGFARVMATEASHTGDLHPVLVALGWIAHWSLIPSTGMFVFLFLLFPDGKLPGPRWRWVARSAIAGSALLALSVAFGSRPMDSAGSIPNPVAIDGWGEGLKLMEDVGAGLLIASGIASLASLVVRRRRAQGDQRQQLKWLFYGATLLLLTGAFAVTAEGSLNELSFIGLLVGLFAIPVALTVALTRYRLYEIDVLVNRTVVYAVLTAAVIVIYILIVGAMGALFQSRVGLAPALIATGLVAVAFQPLRRTLQDTVDRIMYGHRRDPYRALSDLGSRLGSTFHPDEVFPVIVDTVASSLKLGYVAIEVDREGAAVVASTANGAPEATERIPIVYQGEEVGRLLIAAHKGDALSPTDRALLDDLARSAGPAVHAVSLTDALRRSRNELLAAREEERRRLRRDLHDGLGPELAGISLGLRAAANLADTDRAAAESVLTTVRAQAEAATRSIRGLVEGLRPPALDDLGLVGAVQEKATAIAAGSGMTIEVQSDDLPELSAAVEVAALRIALEAVTNAARHAGASACTISFRVPGELVIEVVDDGVGIASDASRGVGLFSMSERAAQVGGTVTWESNHPTGTLVRARLPVG